MAFGISIVGKAEELLSTLWIGVGIYRIVFIHQEEPARITGISEITLERKLMPVYR